MQQHDMKQFEEELIAGIRETLSNYEEPYAPGAWERFEQKEKKRTAILWWPYLSGIAAILIAGFFFLPKTDQQQPQIVNAKKTTPEAGVIQSPGTINTTIKKSDAQLLVTDSKPAIRKEEKQFNKLSNPDNGMFSSHLITAKDTSSALIALHPNPVVKDEMVTVGIVEPSKIETIIPKTDQPVTKQSFEEFLKTETTKVAASEKDDKKENKWALGVVVAPSIGNTDKINIGYGVSVGYALSDKIGIQTGLSYNKIAAGKGSASQNYDAAQNSYGSGSSIVNDKVLESVEGKIAGLDIPLELHYKIDKNFYASAGISAFAILGQKEERNFLVSQQVPQAVVTPGGSTIVQNVIVTRRAVESSPEEAVNSQYIGFYNFSIGYQKKITKKYSWSAEPFLRIPMKAATNDELKLIGTGIRLKFGF